MLVFWLNKFICSQNVFFIYIWVIFRLLIIKLLLLIFIIMFLTLGEELIKNTNCFSLASLIPLFHFYINDSIFILYITNFVNIFLDLFFLEIISLFLLHILFGLKEFIIDYIKSYTLQIPFLLGFWLSFIFIYIIYINFVIYFFDYQFI